MQVLHISDTHRYHEDIPTMTFHKVDLVIHSGDAANSHVLHENRKQLFEFLVWYAKVPVEHKIFSPGNHETILDFGTAEEIAEIQRFCWENNIILLMNSGIEINGLKIWASPVTPSFGTKRWGFNIRREVIGEHWEQIPEELDILITHGPPFGILDRAEDRNSGRVMSNGCWDLLYEVIKKRPKYHLFGHIHNGRHVADNVGVLFHEHIPTVFSNAACKTDGIRGMLTHIGNHLEIP